MHNNDYVDEYIPRPELNFRKFDAIDRDMDYSTYERTFTGRMTRRRWEIIDRFCRIQSYRDHCHHDYDCCGCCCGQSMDFEYKAGQVVITLSLHYNY